MITDTCKTAKILFGTSRELCISLSTALDVPKRIFAVLYVSIMGFTRCYKTTVFTFIYFLNLKVPLTQN